MLRLREKECAMSYTRTSCLCLVALVALSALGEAQAQLQLNTFDMSQAVDVLAGRFQRIANDGLGINALKVSRWIVLVVFVYRVCLLLSEM